MHASRFFIFGHEVTLMISSLRYTGGKHSIGFPVVNVLPFCVAQAWREVSKALVPFGRRAHLVARHVVQPGW